MVVNNWFIIMEGFVSTTSWAARIYFILFWITNIVSHVLHGLYVPYHAGIVVCLQIVLNVSTAYILDGYEMFPIDLANKKIVENYIISGQQYRLATSVSAGCHGNMLRCREDRICQADSV